MSETYKKWKFLEKYNTRAQTMHLSMLLGSRECGWSSSEMALGALCESGQEKLKKKSQKHTKNKTKKSTILGPKQHVRTRRLGHSYRGGQCGGCMK